MLHVSSQLPRDLLPLMHNLVEPLSLLRLSPFAPIEGENSSSLSQVQYMVCTTARDSFATMLELLCSLVAPLPVKEIVRARNRHVASLHIMFRAGGFQGPGCQELGLALGLFLYQYRL
jgi:hypothetical protein